MLKKITIAVMFFSFCFTITCTGVYAVNTNDTRLLSNPALSKDHIAFIYANNLWIARIDGKNPYQLTTDSSIMENSPFFSPDGKTIAFTALRNGNSDVYIIPAEGGISKRLTWHPGYDVAQGFTPDGKSVIFTSGGYSSDAHNMQMFSVPLQGGFPARIPIPNINNGVYSPDGNNIAYNPLPEPFNQWKGYRGGRVSEIWVYNLSRRTFYKIKQPKGRCNDTEPLWIGNKIYFRSDRNGEFNVFSFDTENNDIKQLTFYSDFPVLNFSACDGKIIYEQAGYLHLYDIDTGNNEKLTIGLSPDLSELRERYVTYPNIYNYDISPSGARVVFEARGEIVTLPAKKGDSRNITNTPGINERSPLWSPHGKSIAYFSDESGEYELHIKSQDGKGEVKKYKLSGGGFYENPLWSPDGKKISYMDNNQNLYWINLEDGIIKKIASERMVIDKTVTYDIDYFNNAWSPDSKWIVYTIYTKTYMSKVCLYSVENDKSYPLTDGMSDVTSPVFDESGKYLYFLASTDAGPVNQVTDLSSMDMKMTRSIYLVTLSKDLPSPLAKESDEEKGIQKEDKNKDKKEASKVVVIDLEGIKYRILSLPLPPDRYGKLYPGKAGEFYYLREEPSAFKWRKTNTILRYDLKERKEKTIYNGIYKYTVSDNKEKILCRNSSGWGIISVAGGNPEFEKLDLFNISIKVVPELEWKQIFHEAWRINRDYFYDPNMHGVNWKAMEEKYSSFLPDVATRHDLNRIIRWMCSELRVGHHWVGGGDYPYSYSGIKSGLLGADYVIENGRYKIKKIYGGLNWNPDLRSPLREPGVNVSEGEYLLMVNGKELTSEVDIYSLFENTGGKITELTLSNDPSGKNSHNVSLVPVTSEWLLRHMDWIEGNIAKVDKATGGRVAYVYVPNTATEGYNYFRRYFFPQGYKDALIIDERFNGGGLYADYYIDILRRENVCYFTTRYGDDLRVPGSMIDGPKVMLINEQAGSGGDLLPWTFRKFKMGKLIGKRTWGGLVGVWGFPNLMDGGYITAPNAGTWSDGEWIVENEGVPPDIEVEQNPADVMDGHDPQLEKAIDFIMKELSKKPPEQIIRPPYPDKVKGE